MSLLSLKNLLLSSALLLSVLSANGLPQDNECPPGYELVEISPGDFICQKIVVDCVGGADRRYVDPTSGGTLCCPTGNPLIIYDQTTRVGVCCGANQVYIGDPPNGKCSDCPEGQALYEGNCVKICPA
ncbi:hypothetical protein L218DRAFT_1002224 [Marasmius fiardii PR-910]|nr:hypothetical protein L218DRAFT_1002224 [Marasmius fiardii PR-910]